MKIYTKIFNNIKLAIGAQSFCIFLSFALLMSSSCLTSVLWDKYHYSDTINQYLITKDGKKVIFLGENYHYIFDDNNNAIKELLNWPSRRKLTMGINNFNEVSSDKVEVSIKVTTDSKEEANRLSESELDFLKSLGFKNPKLGKSNNKSILEKYLHFTGKRYLPKPNTSYKFNSSLGKSYHVKVMIKSKNIATKIALTPITVALDATGTVVGIAVIIAGVAVGVVAIPIASATGQF